MRIFVTVGNRTERFDRLIETLDQALSALPGEVEGCCQVGASSARSTYLDNVQFLERSAFNAEIASADAVVCHAGVGTIYAAVSAGHRPLVMARRAEHGECVNDHQLEIVQALEARRLIRAVPDAESLRCYLELPLAGRRRRERRAAPGKSDLDLVGAALSGGSPKRWSGPLRHALLRLLACGAPALTRLEQRRHERRGRHE